MRRLLAIVLLFPMSVLATCTTGSSGDCEVGAGKTYTTIGACLSAVAAGQACRVFAGTYAENPSIPAGTVGNYVILKVNGSDQVQITGTVTLTSHDKLVGNCPALQGIVTTLTCGFFITDPSAPLSRDCVDISGSSTDFFVIANTMYACNGLHINRGSPTHTTRGFIQQNTISYPGTTTATCPPNPGACNVSVALPMSCDFCLIEQNDISHTADFDNEYDGTNNVFRNNSFHDNSQSECLTGTHGDQCHIDFIESEPGSSSYDTKFTVIEGNLHYNGSGSNTHGYLFQADTCSGRCTQVIMRFNQMAHIGGGGLLDDLGGFTGVHLYNNTWVDMNQATIGAGNITNHWKGGSSGGSAVNEIMYYPEAVTNFNAIACEDTSCSPFNHGNNLAFCTGGCPSGSSGLRGFQYNIGGWLDDATNKLADPLFISYSSNGLGDLHLQPTSPALNAGTNLTTANGSGSNITALVVNDAGYFQDGYGITGVQGDCVSITTVGNHVCVTTVNYSTNTLTLASPMSWTSGDKVWLYSDSSGVVRLTGSAPNMGALGSTVQPSSPATWVFADNRKP